MRLKIKLNEHGEIEKRLALLRDRIDMTQREFVEWSADTVKNEAVDSIQSGQKSGRVYVRSHPTRIHQASAPGEAPAEDLGNLVASISIQGRGSNQYTTKRQVGTSSWIGKLLEFGGPGKGGSYILPRPWLLPAYNFMKEQAEWKLRELFERS